MKYKITIQAGVLDKKPEDIYGMFRDPADLVGEALERVTIVDFREELPLTLATGEPHLRTFVAEIKNV